MNKPSEMGTTKPTAPTTGKTVTVPKTPGPAKAPKTSKATKPQKAPKAEDPNAGYRPIRNRLRSTPTSGPNRRMRVRFPAAILVRVKKGGELGVPFSEFVEAVFVGRMTKSKLAIPPRPLKGRTISVSAAVAEEVLAFEKDGGDLDRLVWAAIAKQAKL